mmetsp:Transcript_14044/g.28658  ORF Transcript_14044/g.28658 Transcript_14044/m.28658 type:complete len:237 (+) Transcript_14044:784-1494(+)
MVPLSTLRLLIFPVRQSPNLSEHENTSSIGTPDNIPRSHFRLINFESNEEPSILNIFSSGKLNRKLYLPFKGAPSSISKLRSLLKLDMIPISNAVQFTVLAALCSSGSSPSIYLIFRFHPRLRSEICCKFGSADAIAAMPLYFNSLSTQKSATGTIVIVAASLILLFRRARIISFGGRNPKICANTSVPRLPIVLVKLSSFSSVVTAASSSFSSLRFFSFGWGMLSSLLIFYQQLF